MLRIVRVGKTLTLLGRSIESTVSISEDHPIEQMQEKVTLMHSKCRRVFFLFSLRRDSFEFEKLL
jgi:hypothetical protein